MDENAHLRIVKIENFFKNRHSLHQGAMVFHGKTFIKIGCDICKSYLPQKLNIGVLNGQVYDICDECYQTIKAFGYGNDF